MPLVPHISRNPRGAPNWRRADERRGSIRPTHAMVTTFEVDQLVVVAERQWPGVNKEGGAARVVKVHDDNTVGVKYIINNRSEASVHVKVRSRRSCLVDLLAPVRG